jgi:crossover junction endodeoxyribonuclease RusA
MILPLPPSINHMYANAYIKGRSIKVYTQQANAWRQQALYLIKPHIKRTIDEKIIIELYYYFPDARRRDTHNTLKILCDVLEEAGLVTDDRYLLPRVMDYEIDRQNPRIEIIVKELNHGQVET